MQYDFPENPYVSYSLEARRYRRAMSNLKQWTKKTPLELKTLLKDAYNRSRSPVYKQALNEFAQLNDLEYMWTEHVTSVPLYLLYDNKRNILHTVTTSRHMADKLSAEYQFDVTSVGLDGDMWDSLAASVEHDRSNSN